MTDKISDRVYYYNSLSPSISSSLRNSMSQSALDLWQQKLAFLQQQEAITSDPTTKFSLQKAIEECQLKIAKLSDPSPAPPPSPKEKMGRRELMTLLKQLVPQQFNELLFEIDPPAGIVPPSPAPQADRVMALLTWADSPTGCGLERVQQALDDM